MNYRPQLGELDISEEAEELREYLYSIVNNYPAGIDSKLLEQLYIEKYVETGLGRNLPRDWLRQLQFADEFEVKNVAGLTTVYIAHKTCDFVNINTETPSKITDLKEIKETLPDIENTTDNNNTPLPSTTKSSDNSSKIVKILSVDTDFNFCYVRDTDRKEEFKEFVKIIGEYYTEHHKDADLYVDVLDFKQIYAVLDNVGNWCRVIIKDGEEQSTILSCFFVDYGEIRSVVRRSLKKLSLEFSVEVIPTFNRCCSTNLLTESKATNLPHLIKNNGIVSLKKTNSTKIKLSIIKTIDEYDYDVVIFEDDSGNKQTMNYLKNIESTQSNTSPKVPQLPPPVPVPDFQLICRDPDEMPKKKEIVHIISATDPENISIQLAAWHPAPAYLASAMTRDSENSSIINKDDIKIGNFYAAKLDDSWERVQAIRQSKTVPGGDYWVVFAVDVGNFHLIHYNNLRYLTESVNTFGKILLAKCRLAGIKKSENGVWSKETQQGMQDLLQTTSKSVVEFLPDDGWIKKSFFDSPDLPYTSGQLFIDGKNFAEQLISMGLAEKE